MLKALRATCAVSLALTLASCGGEEAPTPPAPAPVVVYDPNAPTTPPPTTPTPTPTPTSAFMTASKWELGPVIDGKNTTVGVDKRPVQTTDGWAFTIPGPTADDGHVHYVTTDTGSLEGKTKVVMKFRVELDPGVTIVPRKFPTSPSLLTLYFQREEDNWTAQNQYEAYRWWASFATMMPITAGEYVMEAPFSSRWTAILTSNSYDNATGFKEALKHAGRIGFTLGGGDGLGHGVYATGRARFVVTDFHLE